MKRLLKAVDHGVTAFLNELWLPTIGFHLFDDPADCLEDVITGPVAASAGAAVKDPAGVESPTAPAGQPELTPYDLYAAAAGLEMWLDGLGLKQGERPLAWKQTIERLKEASKK